jgi:hypothetical protein
MNLSELVASFQTPGTVLMRRAGGMFIQGQWRGDEIAETDLIAVVQPLDHRTKIAMELQTTDAAITIYTSVPLYTNDTSDKTSADRIRWRGDIYEVQSVEDWQLQGGYFKSVARKVSQ